MSDIPSGPLLARISDRRRRLTELERERLVLEAELRAYEDALALTRGPDVILSNPPYSTRRSQTRSRSLSEQWKNILVGMHSLGRPASVEDIVELGRRAGSELSEGNVRSQMALYVERGYVQRPSPGSYVVSEKGLDEVQRGEPAAEDSVSEDQGN